MSDLPEVPTPLHCWTVDETAAYLRVNRRTVLRMANRGDLPHMRIGPKVFRFDPEKVRDLHDQEQQERACRCAAS